MFIDIAPILAGVMMQQAEDFAFDKAMNSLPAEVAEKLRKDRADKREQYRLEALAERRHQETINAIRSTSFWRMGS